MTQSLAKQNAYLSTFVGATRLEKIEHILQQRTEHITLVLEDTYQAHNISAVIRSCECFGIQNLHMIENNYPFKINRAIVMGANHWISIHHYNKHANNTINCVDLLKKQGYAIAALNLSPKAIPLSALPLTDKLALCIGTEKTGLSAQMITKADYQVKIPMVGFTQSLNLSVTAGIALSQLRARLCTEVPNWQLNTSVYQQLKCHWLRRSIPNGDKILAHFLAK